jgi:hypothetical protein
MTAGGTSKNQPASLTKHPGVGLLIAGQAARRCNLPFRLQTRYIKAALQDSPLLLKQPLAPP